MLEIIDSLNEHVLREAIHVGILLSVSIPVLDVIDRGRFFRDLVPDELRADLIEVLVHDRRDVNGVEGVTAATSARDDVQMRHDCSFQEHKRIEDTILLGSNDTSVRCMMHSGMPTMSIPECYPITTTIDSSGLTGLSHLAKILPRLIRLAWYVFLYVLSTSDHQVRTYT